MPLWPDRQRLLRSGIYMSVHICYYVIRVRRVAAARRIHFTTIIILLLHVDNNFTVGNHIGLSGCAVRSVSHRQYV